MRCSDSTDLGSPEKDLPQAKAGPADWLPAGNQQRHHAGLCE
jgi:hypothetical protein